MFIKVPRNLVTALRGAATLKARALKDVWNMAAVIPVEKGNGNRNGGNGIGSNDGSNGSFSGELIPEDNFLSICSQELLARGCELLKRTRGGIGSQILVHMLYHMLPLINFDPNNGTLILFAFLNR